MHARWRAAFLCACSTMTSSNHGGLGGSPDAEIDGPAGTAPVLVKNYQSQCSVSLMNGAASTAEVLRVDVNNIVVPMTAVAVQGFRLGATPWHHTDGDHGAGDAGMV